MADLNCQCLFKYLYNTLIGGAEKCFQFAHELLDSHVVEFGQGHHALGGHDDIDLVVGLVHADKLINTHLLDEDGFGAGDATAACEAVVQRDSGLLLLGVLLHDLGLDAALRWSNVVIDLCQFYNTREHSDIYMNADVITII